mmetsp:Transcript_9018/g.16502  ORF Transcript_9018/g.16502 Transcript_9018/m.16502 type:complete len:86 (-) Transcript_9018:545-802(-)
MGISSPNLRSRKGGSIISDAVQFMAMVNDAKPKISTVQIRGGKYGVGQIVIMVTKTQTQSQNTSPCASHAKKSSHLIENLQYACA